MSHLQIIESLELVTELQANAIKALATRLAELGDTETNQDEIAKADAVYREIVDGDCNRDNEMKEINYEQTWNC